MIYYAVKYLPTGALMPQLYEGGATRRNPQDWPRQSIPRLFTLRRYARTALVSFGRGKAHRDPNTGEVFYIPEPDRKIEDFTIVTMTLKEKPHG
jgi:hypothetical protein